MTEQVLADYHCPYAETYSEISKFLKEGRTCKISGELCFNWDKHSAVETCKTRKDHEKRAMSEKIIFEMIIPKEVTLTRKQVEDRLNDLCCLGVSEQNVKHIPNGFRLIFNRQEWMDSWKSVGFPLKEGEEAKPFEEELKGSWLSDFEGYEKIRIVKKETTLNDLEMQE